MKGVPVRLCAKIEVLRLDDENKTIEAGPEIYYYVVKLFRDYSVERKSTNDKKLAEKRIVKLHKQKFDIKTTADFDRRNCNNSPIDEGKFDSWLHRGRRLISLYRCSISREDIHTELAKMT